MQKILKAYLRRLTNLTASNRSLLLLRLRASHFIDLDEADFTTSKSSFGVIEELIGRKKSIQICPVVDPRDQRANELSVKLKRLERTEKFILEETGSRDLYVGWPFLRGRFSDDTLVRCPLMFFPVELAAVSGQWVLKQREGVNVTLNKTFLLAYAHFNKVKIGEDLLERVFDDFDTDSTVFRTALYQLFKESPIEINFNPENFSNRLAAFESFTKPDFETLTSAGEIKLMPEAVLGIFPQAGSHLVPDYTRLIESQGLENFEEFFAARSGEELGTKTGLGGNQIDRVREENIVTPFRLDAYQERALKAVKDGRSIVVQGPPGTGKSQLICNIISDSIASGKNVLLVSQKRAALDVVFERLADKELDAYAAIVHDFKNDRKTIYEKIAKHIGNIPQYKVRNNGLDLVQIERSFQTSSRNIDRLTEELEEYKLALFDDSECDLSIKELYLTSTRSASNVNLRQEYRHFVFGDMANTINRLRTFIHYSQKFTRDDYPLVNRKSFHNLGLSDLKAMQSILVEIPKVQDDVGNRVAQITGEKLSLEDCNNLLGQEEQVETLKEIIAEPKVYEYFQNAMSAEDKEPSMLALTNSERVISECFRGVGIETSLSTRELGRLQEVLVSASKSTKNVISYLHWRWFSKDKIFIRRVFVANGLRNNKRGLLKLVKKVDNRLNLEHNLTKLREMEWLRDFPEEYQKVSYQSWFHLLKQALKAREVFLSVRNFKDFFAIPSLMYDEFIDNLDGLFSVLREIPDHRNRWLPYFTPNQIASLSNDPSNAHHYSETLNGDFDALCEFDALQQDLRSYEREVFDRVLDHEDVTGPDKAEGLFQNSLRLAWIDHIEAKYPILRATASQKFGSMTSELQRSVEEKAEVSLESLLVKLRERTYENAEYNRLNNMVTYRDLLHQATKKRRIWPLRKLISHHHHELFDLLPCWMASPEAVSAIFPMEKIFDVVVFDEASQCFAERGIPAMFRGRQVVIAGDSKQLQPNDLYQIRWEEDDEEEPELEIDSLLELAVPHLPNIMLQEHYRSKSLDLIDFSNQHFYDGELSMLPDLAVANGEEPGIHYMKVDGIWENNVNKEEATKVVELLLDISKEDPAKSIGVVTFNARQQSLILDLIDDLVNQGQGMPSQLFVKNIENVQGDERDIIIFSTGYSKDPKGRLIMQFGSLNAEGGENRLNVAITRAREKIYIVSSIFPGQLKVDDTKNEGPKLLRDYLAYASDVSNGVYKPTLRANKIKSQAWYLKSRISHWAHDKVENATIQMDMPFADLTVSHPEGYIGLVLTDDDLYFEAPSAKAAHVYTPYKLALKNWKYREVHSRDYWQNPDTIKESLQRFVNLNLIEDND